MVISYQVYRPQFLGSNWQMGENWDIFGRYKFGANQALQKRLYNNKRDWQYKERDKILLWNIRKGDQGQQTIKNWVQKQQVKSQKGIQDISNR